MIRRLKHEVRRCPVCNSSVVPSWSGHYPDGKRHWSLVCCNPKCRKRSPGGFDTQEAAIQSWDASYGTAI